MRPAIIYRRVSTVRQDEDGKSLEDQDSELDLYCRAMGYEIVGNFEDAISGRREKTHKRKGLEKALAMACQEKATLVVYSLDRLARSQSAGLRAIERLQDCGANVVVKNLGVDTNTPSGKAMLGVGLAFAEWGSAMIGEAVKRANRQTVREKGYRTQGSQPFGWKIVNGELTEVPAEQELIAKVREYYRKNRKSVYATVQALNRDQIPTPGMVRNEKPGRWFYTTVKLLLGRK